MRKAERVLMWTGVVVAIGLGLGVGIPERPAIAQAGVQGTASKIGTVDVFTLLEALVESDGYKPAREARDAELKTRYDAMLAELRALETRIQIIPQGTPEFNATMQQGQAKQSEIQQFAQQAQRDQDAFVADQVKRAYQQIHAATNAVADRLGYSHVIATRLETDNMKAESMAPAMQEILARPLIRSVASEDITAAVRAELNLPEPTPAATPAPEGDR